MICKYIRCAVDPEFQQAFSTGQEEWSQTSECSGFRAQLGGWNAANNRAVIFSLWEDEASVKSFMENEHDVIAERAAQKKSYNSCTVSYLERVLIIPSLEKPVFPEKECRFIRMADCKVIPNMDDEFIHQQRTIWNPGMAPVEGMLGGSFWGFSQEPGRYLVTTFWKTEKDHKNYIDNHFPKLKSRSRDSVCLESLSGLGFDCEKKWGVFPAVDKF